jgi:dTDP-4-amino-4,6-dideoxygalactose transaminase
MHELKINGISTQVHYIPVIEHPYYQKNGYSLSSYPATEKYYQETLSLPLYYSLTDCEQEKVIRCLGDILN